MKKKSLLCIILALGMLTTTFFGCSGNTENEASASVSPTEVSPAGKADETATGDPYAISLPITDELTTVTLWSSTNPQALQYTSDLGETSVYKYVESITNVRLEMTGIAGNLVSNAFPVMIASGDYCDMLGNVYDLYPGGLDAAVEDEVLIDLKDLIPEYSPNYYRVLNSRDEWLNAAVTDSGRMVAFAALTINAWGDSGGLIIREDWLEKVDMEVPATYDEMYEVLKAFKTELGAKSPLWVNNMGVGNENTLTDGYGVPATIIPVKGYAPFFVMDNSVRFGYSEAGFREYLEMMQAWYSEGLVWKDFAADGSVMGITNSIGYQSFLNGEMGVVFGEKDVVTAGPEQTLDSGMVLAGIPDLVKSRGDILHNGTYDSSVALRYGVSTSCDREKIPVICKYMDFFYTEKGTELASWGVQGETWNYNAAGEKEFTELVTNNPDGMSFNVIFNLYITMGVPALLDGSRNKAVFPDNIIKTWDNWASNKDGAYYYPSFATLTPDESSEYSSLWNEISTYAAESIPKFIAGELSIESKFDGFISMMNELGLERCVEIKQGAYNRYMER